MDIELKDVKEFIEANKDDADVKEYLNSFTNVTPEKVQDFLTTDQGKQLLQPMLDRHFSKGLETWKEKSLPDILKEKEEEIRTQLQPKETEEQKRLREVEARLQKAETERDREKRLNSAVKIAQSKGLPVDLVNYFVGDDDDTTISNLNTFENAFKESLSKAIESGNGEKLKEASREVKRGAPTKTTDSLEAKYNEAQKMAQENPGDLRAQAQAIKLQRELHQERQKKQGQAI